MTTARLLPEAAIRAGQQPDAMPNPHSRWPYWARFLLLALIAFVVTAALYALT